MMKKFYIGFCVLLLIYMIMPGPSKISDFQALPKSDKSTLAGDNIEQVSNVAAYFSNNYRKAATSFYSKNYKNQTWLPFSPLRINHPPEFSWNVIKKHTDGTYLEEFVYPMRDSLYVNGFEPFYEDKTPKYWGAGLFGQNGHSWETKVTLRFFPSTIFVRLLVWFGTVISILFLYRLGKRIIF